MLPVGLDPPYLHIHPMGAFRYPANTTHLPRSNFDHCTYGATHAIIPRPFVCRWHTKTLERAQLRRALV